MFIEITGYNGDVFLINLSQISFIRRKENGTKIVLIDDQDAIIVDDSYENIRDKIFNAIDFFKKHDMLNLR
jgi:uncharacterized protein YlzI (FlbEa/FlbD family)